MNEGFVRITENDMKDMRGHKGSYELEQLVRRYGAEVPVSEIFSLINYSLNHPGYIYKSQRNMALTMASLLQKKLCEKVGGVTDVPTLVDQLSLPEKGNMFDILLKEKVSQYEQEMGEFSKEMTRKLNSLKQQYETEASELESSYLARIVTLKGKISKMKALTV
jgi:hypothetical protein